MDIRTGMVMPEEDIPKGQKKYFIPVRRDLSVKEKADAQIALYAPCGCGSEKKFKFCCKKP
jgi:uncharacterized protein YecA (UPF0149 family)